MILILQYPNVGDREQRQAEFEYCLRANCANPHIDKVLLLQEPDATVPIEHEKIEARFGYGRMQYQNGARAAAYHPGEICIIANADVEFDDTLKLVTPEKLKDVVVCLSRDDIQEDMFEGDPCSRTMQDAWIFMSPLRGLDKMNLAIELGRPACDNRFAYELSKAYRLINPCDRLIIRHHHQCLRHTSFLPGEGPVDEPGNEACDRIKGPYEFVPPTEGF